MILKKISFLTLLVVVGFSCKSNEYSLQSPDASVELMVSLVDNSLNYKLIWEGEEMVGLSELGLFPDSEMNILGVKATTADTTWHPVWDQSSSVRDHYQQLEISLQCDAVKGKLLARAYNEGVAFRFILDEGQKPENAVLTCSYALPDGSQFFAPHGESEPLGPLSFDALNKYHSQKSKKGKKNNIQVPLVVETPSHSFMALLESDLYAAPGFNAMQLGVDNDARKVLSENKIKLSEKALTTPWRVILLGKTAGDLVVNNTTINLATPNQLENNDWIKPGKTLWDWRVHGYTAPDGFVYGINTESYLRFIDFAAETGIEYFLIDDSWYTHATKGHFELSDKLDLDQVITYAAEKEVELILYYDRKHGQYGDEALFPYYKSLGMKGVKYGFMGSNPDFSRKAIQMSAENELLIDFHDSPVPFTGMRRTYPNAITREYCHAQQDSRRAFTPESFLKMALINAISGPLDMNNGNFDLSGINSGLRQKGPKKLNSYMSTVVSEVARTLVIFSGLVCIPDAPEAYAAKSDLFAFIQKMPVGKWDESHILNSKIGEHITTARRHGDEWFVGSVIDQQGGTLDINMDFLEANKTYEVTFYEDTEETHCKTNPEAYQIRQATVTKDEIIKAQLAPGGGHCMWIRPLQ